MAGLGGTYAAALLVLVLSGVIMTMYAVVLRGPMLILESGVDVVTRTCELESKLSLSGSPYSIGSTIYVNLTNEGPRPVDVRNLDLIDVIVEYVPTGSDESTCERLPFLTQPDPQSKGWTITNITTSEGKPEIENPVDIPYFTRGFWDQGEIATLEINVPDLDPSEPILVVITSPSGSRVSIHI